jgi:hypothetical protein
MFGVGMNVLRRKLEEERTKATADPSTSFGSGNEPNFAQDDRFSCSASFGLRTQGEEGAGLQAGSIMKEGL